jgi:hypothetical protein
MVLVEGSVYESWCREATQSSLVNMPSWHDSFADEVEGNVFLLNID